MGEPARGRLRAAEAATSETRYGYLLVHHVEAPEGDGERIHFSLSDGDDPRSWTRLNGGQPVLTSRLGTRGVRDAHLVRGADAYFLMATDLRIYGGDRRGWEAWTRTGSRSIVVWRSRDLVRWSEPWLLEVAPPNAGMAWAPEATYDPERGDFLVYWSSRLFAEDDPRHEGDGYSRVLVARTPDFRGVGPASVLIDLGTDVIDTTVHVDGGTVHRFSKENSFGPDSIRLFQQSGPDFFSDRFRTTATRIADTLYAHVEGPLVFKDNHRELWYLFVDQFARRPQGYVGLTTTDLDSGHWEPIPPDAFHMPPNTKHGAVLPLTGDQWQVLRSAFPG
ncbi:glycoside hydrolase family 43 protein [Streptomyces hainanensis]|uniref:1,4-beta-xylanase n=1 Tax=Streptomyces hainanensis TaxID=402648 RepID=A0A4R4T8X5_9ACTN|nr:glycoside hydrolase family 43 protein [Streptomyces hainanensis]TDC72426.1 1,4-beta-xylanase [Streptomyces hainanensis]